jgi:hypothetical protein
MIEKLEKSVDRSILTAAENQARESPSPDTNADGSVSESRTMTLTELSLHIVDLSLEENTIQSHANLVNPAHKTAKKYRHTPSSTSLDDKTLGDERSAPIERSETRAANFASYPQSFGTAKLLNDPFRDASNPYDRLTDVLLAIVERPSFACSYCNKDCKTKSALK